eukprot:CAMPEP_0181331874 /NCGR_PEP_ID=MMETSP1101-20121128/24765_1 /TAXON_ID=46948 /ORGANISM="Rhodomonas abbreviata, Strain Caron Lab Isolate" /LENGTH=145 /DNA_ID=CAMNT_0023441425 /DNA_START=258 /DNA_END=697 /DNA_ORIENTATION=-
MSGTWRDNSYTHSSRLESVAELIAPAAVPIVSPVVVHAQFPVHAGATLPQAIAAVTRDEPCVGRQRVHNRGERRVLDLGCDQLPRFRTQKGLGRAQRNVMVGCSATCVMDELKMEDGHVRMGLRGGVHKGDSCAPGNPHSDDAAR